ncbi:DNA polymerase III subunit epsilon [Reinekea marinisedimentorum]|uniref:DNA polymerase III subunit epsilon n=1 Tax=Reinekea marinisedimentorum TaxID=230495 RepID=A0A4R3ID85_9GAMM|nr:DNA polymerase III subunit epsilon [Reinekea marinisedimentorum]TCS42615.1 DNA polymerase-3 subunit epsilon [Reinekea marinisedimentorum]
MRLVILDTETTGLNPKKGDRIVEVGCVEMVERKLTGRHYHEYINPERDIPDEVVAVHGIDNERVKDCPKFRDIAVDLWTWLEGADLVIHNAAFDMGFLNAEFQRFADEQGESFAPLESVCGVIDTLKIAREKHPGSKVSLDALCKRYDIDNSHRTLHGALLDSEILADVYLYLTGGQTDLMLAEDEEEDTSDVDLDFSALGEVKANLITVKPSNDELEAHKLFMEMLAKKSGKEIDWPAV